MIIEDDVLIRTNLLTDLRSNRREAPGIIKYRDQKTVQPMIPEDDVHIGGNAGSRKEPS